MKYPKNKDPKSKRQKEFIKLDHLWVAPLFIFNAVLAKAAVTGIPPKNPESKFANERLNISFFLLNLNLVFVIESAIFAEMRVSSTTTKIIGRQSE